VTVWAMLTKGGWLMIPIAVCLATAIWVTIDRAWAYTRLRASGDSTVGQAIEALKSGRPEDAQHILEVEDDPVAGVILAAVSVRDRDRDTIKEAVENEGNRAAYTLEAKLGVLATISGVAPLIGFLGTVTGMIRAFQDIEYVIGNVTAKILAGGIWEAMVTTAFGLSVGILATVAYNYLVSRVQRFSNDLETAVGAVIPILTDSGSSS